MGTQAGCHRPVVEERDKFSERNSLNCNQSVQASCEHAHPPGNILDLRRLCCGPAQQVAGQGVKSSHGMHHACRRHKPEYPQVGNGQA